MKRIILAILILVVLVITGLIVSAVSINQTLDDKDYLMTQIRNEKHLIAHDYKVNRYTVKEVDDYIKALPPTTNPKDIPVIRKNMIAKKDIITFFYQSKHMIQYYVSYDRDKNVCRLAAETNHPFLHLGISGTKNHVLHEIDKPICNGLYGYGKAF